MNSDFSYSTSYILDKSHYSETFDESVIIDTSYRPYVKAIVVALIGLVMLYVTDISPYFCWFLIGLGGVEALSVRFQKAWWLGRQIISKAANNEMTLTINSDGVFAKSLYVDGKILWSDIKRIEATKQGWLLHLVKGKTYISNRTLSDQAKAYIESKAEDING